MRLYISQPNSRHSRQVRNERMTVPTPMTMGMAFERGWMELKTMSAE